MTLNPSGISIVVCCYNSEKRIRETLQYIIAQQVPVNIIWEVILIDNACTDNTCKVATETWEAANINVPFSIKAQPLPGLSKAREKGIEAAQYSFILFCDDDNWFDPNYVANGYTMMAADNSIGVAGGFSAAAPEAPVPDWFQKRISHYSVGSQEKFAADNWVYGAGSICRKDALMKLNALNWSPITSDRLGDVYLYGGDNEICYMLKLLGYKIVYNSKLTFQHFIPQERLSELYIEKSAFGSYFSEFFLYPYFYYLSKKFKQKSFAGFLFFFCFYYTKTFCSSLFKYILPVKMDAYQKKMNALHLRAMIKSLPNFKKIFSHFKLLKKIIDQQQPAS